MVTQLSCHTERTSTAIVTSCRIIGCARILILAEMSVVRAEEKSRDKKQSKMNFLVNKNLRRSIGLAGE